MSNLTNTPIGLQELIQRVKQELLQPDETQPLFAIEKVELEVSFTVDRAANGGVDFQVVQAGVEKNWGHVQKVKLTLDPIIPRDQLGQNLTAGQKHMAQQALEREAADID